MDAFDHNNGVEKVLSVLAEDAGTVSQTNAVGRRVGSRLPNCLHHSRGLLLREGLVVVNMD